MKKTALITGASSGLGLDLAKLFAADGYDLVLVARSEGKLRELAESLEKSHGAKSRVVVADLARPEAPEEIAAQLRDVEIDALVNNAGFGFSGAFLSNDKTMELDMIQVNVTALTHLTKLFLPQMVARGRGHIMNVASTAAFQPGPYMAVYYATKAFVLSFTEAIAQEVRNKGVRVTAFCPGATSTGFAAVADMENSPIFTAVKPMSSPEAAAYGFKAMKKGRVIAIPGLRNRLLVQSLRVSPRAAVRRVIAKLQAR